MFKINYKDHKDVNKDVNDVVLVSLLLTLISRFCMSFQCFYCWFWVHLFAGLEKNFFGQFLSSKIALRALNSFQGKYPRSSLIWRPHQSFATNSWFLLSFLNITHFRKSLSLKFLLIIKLKFLGIFCETNVEILEQL